MKNLPVFRSTLAGCCCFLPLQPVIASSDIDELVVTATRTPVAMADSLASVTAISRSDLEARQPLDLVDVFRQVPSLDISRSGGPGSATSLYTRGTASGHTLILVDGQRVSSATLGSANFQFLNPDQIERIEVVRGARSSLYGSEAIGGVIQIFTRDGSASEGSYLTTAAGSNAMYRLALGSSGNSGNWRYGVHASYLETEGIDNLAIDTGFNKDRDGYRNKSVSASTGYRFDNGADLSFRYLESNNRNEHDSASNASEKPYSEGIVQNINLRGRLPLTDVWSTELSLGVSTDDSDNFDSVTGLNQGDFRTERQQLFWQNDIVVAEGHLLTLGYDYYEDDVASNSNDYLDGLGNPVRSRDNKALFGQYQASWRQLDVVLGLREDDNQEFGDHTTGNAAIGLQLSESYKLIASWSEGFKAPTFNDLYWPAGPFSAGNPDLEPESSENSELSLRGDYDNWHWSIAYFENDVKNLIDWAPGADFVWRPYNVSDAEISGAEFAIGGDMLGWRVDAAYSYVEPRDAGTDKLLIKRSRDNLTLNANREFDALTLGLSLKSQGQRYTNTANTESLGGYATFDLRLGYRLTRQLEATFKMENIFDRDYQLNKGYNQEGREWQLGLTYTF